MHKKVKTFLGDCKQCAMFSDKKTSEPIQSHEVPSKCWDSVAVDLFGPMPSKNHVIVVQDLASRFPAAKLVSSTSANKVLPALSEIYDAYGNPSKQLSDNGSPFNSKDMANFAKSRDIELENIASMHPASNPAETFMRPLGKAMKIARNNHQSEKGALAELLNNYRDTPHPATGLAPGAMLFRDEYRSKFPTASVSDKQVNNARQRDFKTKKARMKNTNKSKFRKTTDLHAGDHVLVRNFNKTQKFGPTFSEEIHEVVGLCYNKGAVKVIRKDDSKEFI